MGAISDYFASQEAAHTTTGGAVAKYFSSTTSAAPTAPASSSPASSTAAAAPQASTPAPVSSPYPVNPLSSFGKAAPSLNVGSTAAQAQSSGATTKLSDALSSGIEGFAPFQVLAKTTGGEKVWDAIKDVYGDPLKSNLNANDINGIIAKRDELIQSGYDPKKATIQAAAAIKMGKATQYGLSHMMFSDELNPTSLELTTGEFAPRSSNEVEQAWKDLGSPKTEEDMVKNYKTLAHQAHPDKIGGSSEAFIKLQNSYNILKNNGLPADLVYGGGSTPSPVAPEVAPEPVSEAPAEAPVEAPIEPQGKPVTDIVNTGKTVESPAPTTPVNSPSLNPPTVAGQDITKTNAPQVNLSGKEPVVNLGAKVVNYKPTTTLEQIVKQPKPVAGSSDGAKKLEPSQEIIKTPKPTTKNVSDYASSHPVGSMDDNGNKITFNVPSLDKKYVMPLSEVSIKTNKDGSFTPHINVWGGNGGSFYDHPESFPTEQAATNAGKQEIRNWVDDRMNATYENSDKLVPKTAKEIKEYKTILNGLDKNVPTEEIIKPKKIKVGQHIRFDGKERTVKDVMNMKGGDTKYLTVDDKGNELWTNQASMNDPKLVKILDEKKPLEETHSAKNGEELKKRARQLAKEKAKEQRAGFISGKGALEGIKETADNLKETFKERHEIAKLSANVDDSFRALKNADTADGMKLRKVLKDSRITPEEEKNIDKAVDSGDRSKLTSKEKEVLDKMEPVLLQEEARNIKILTGRDVDTTEYSPRYVMARDPFFHKMMRGDENVSGKGGGLLKKTTGNLKGRVMMAAEDASGNRKIISIKHGDITEWKNGEGTVIGKTRVAEPGQVKEFYDKVVMGKLEKLAQDLGIDHQRVVKMQSGAAGFSVKGQNIIKTRAATPEEVILHEIGHQLDAQYGIGEGIVNSAKFQTELRNLADKRFEGQEVTPSFKNYVRKSSEKVAVMFEAYLHAPEIFKSTAPEVYKWFEWFLGEHEATKPILDLKPSLVLDSRTVGEKMNQPDTFLDKSGKRWNIVEAKKSEIEANTGIKYSPYWLSNHLVAIQRLRAAVRATTVINKLMESPDFANLSVKLGEEEVPKGWKITDAPQLRAYAFEPKIADVINRYFTNTSDNGVLELAKVGVYIRNVSLFNPIYHPWVNVLPNWLAAKGWDMFNPIKYPAELRSGIHALKAILDPLTVPSKGLPSYTELLDHNMTLTSGVAQSLLNDEIKDRIGEALTENLELSNPAMQSLNEDLKKLGWANPVKVADWLIGKNGISFKAAMMSEDVARMQIAYQTILSETGGKGIPEDMPKADKDALIARAVKKVDAIFPTNRISPGQYEIMNTLSPSVTKALTHNMITLFMQYHASQISTIYNDAKEGVGGSNDGGGKMAAWGRIAALVFVLSTVYTAYDGFLKWATNNPTAMAKRGGEEAMLYHLQQYLDKKENFNQAMSGSITFQPLLIAALETFENHDFFTGNQLTMPGQPSNPFTTFMNELGSDVVVSSNIDAIAAGKKPVSTYLLSLVGINTPKSSPSLVNADEMVYNERSSDYSAMKASLAKGDTKGAQSIMNDYNSRLLTNMTDAALEMTPEKGGAWSKVIHQFQLENGLLKGTREKVAAWIWNQTKTDSKLRAEFLQMPSDTVMNNYGATEAKTNMEKLNL